MRAFLVPVTDPIPPFGEPARDACVGGMPLHDYLAETCAALGVELVQVPDLDAIPESATPCLVLRDDLFITRRCLRGFLKAAHRGGRDARLALPDSLLMQRYHHLQELERDSEGRYLFDAFYLTATPSPRARPSRWPHAEPLCPPFKERQLSVPVPRNIVGRSHHLHPVTTTVAMNIRHWVHILWANNLMPQIRLVERITSQPLATIWRLFGSVGLSRTRMFERAMHRFSYRGPGCRVHPTARVELSVLGPGVEIGAFALVRGSLLGAGTIVEDRANVCFSSLASTSFVSRNSTLIACAGYPEADLCVNGMQFCLAGRHTALTSFVRPLDMRYRDDVSVLAGDRLVPLPGHVLGSCFGHGVFVGPDIAIQAGRAIPCGAVIVPEPGTLLGRVPSSWPTGQLGVVRQGRLEKL